MEAMPEIRVLVRYIGAKVDFYHPHFTGEIVWNTGDVHELPASRAKEVLVFTDTFERADVKKEAVAATAPAPASEGSEQSADEAQAQALAAAETTVDGETGATSSEPTAEEIAAGKHDQPSGKKSKRQ